MSLTRPLFGLCLLLVPQAPPPGDPFAAALAAYAAGRHQEARDGFQALAEAAGDAASPELLGNLALAALRLQRTGDAEPAVARLREHADPAERARGEFLAGWCHWQRCDVAEAAAKLQDAEPFAYDAALASARRAMRAFLAADQPAAPWPAARANAERAARRLAALTEAKAKADAAQRRQQEASPPPPSPAPPDGAEEAPAPAPAPAVDAAAVLQKLQQKELEKRRSRQVAQRGSLTAGGRDW